MEKKRFYYVVVSVMRKDGTRLQTSVHSCIKGTEDEDDLKFYPIYKTIKSVENHFKGTKIIPATIIVENVTEISEQDYNALEERSAALHKEKEG